MSKGEFKLRLKEIWDGKPSWVPRIKDMVAVAQKGAQLWKGKLAHEVCDVGLELSMTGCELLAVDGSSIGRELEAGG